MLTKLGNIIEKRPWFVVLIIFIITIGFASFIPSLEMKTEIQDFMPDDEIVQANNRISNYFGVAQQFVLLRVQKQKTMSTITPQALKTINNIQKELNKIPGVNGVISLNTFLDVVCLLEFTKTLEDCDTNQINIALNDLLTEPKMGEIQIFEEDDSNELIDFNRFPRISKGKSIDSIDIKNCYISKNNETIRFSIEVYDLSHFQSTLKPSFPLINVMEWYIDFENLILSELDIGYKITAHIEPKHAVWEIGKGFIANLKTLLQNIRNRELINSYKKEVYLWIKPPGQDMSYPLPLETGNISFDMNTDRVNIEVSLDEMRTFGIAPKFGSFELPAKLSKFKAGTRYYQTPGIKILSGRFTINTHFLVSRIERLRNRPILGSIASRILQKFDGMTWEDFDELFEMMEQSDMKSDTLALKDIESTWTYSDISPNFEVSDEIFSILPSFIEDIQVNALSFLSIDYEKTKKPEASLIIVQINFSRDYERSLQINEEIFNRVTELNGEQDIVSIEATGEGIISTQMNEITEEANQILAPLMFIIIIGILFISFRKTSYVFLPIIALGISTIWLFGTMVLMGIPFTVMSVAFIPLILGLGVDYSVHLFHNYQAELDKGKTPGEAIKRSVKEIGTAMFLAMLTTVIAFMSFLSSSLPPIRNFGVLLGLGIIYTFITAITLLASIRYILDRKKKGILKRKTKKLSVNNIMGKTALIVIKNQKKILIIMVLFSILFASGASQLETRFDLNEFLPEDNPALDLYDKIGEDFPFSSQDQEFILIEGNVATVDVLKDIAKTHRNLEDDTYISRNIDGSVKATSIYTLIIQAVENNESLIERFNVDKKSYIPKTDKDVRELYDYLLSNIDINLDDYAIDSIDMDSFGLDDLDLESIDIDTFDMDDLGTQVESVLYRNNSKYEATVIRIYIDTGLQIDSGDINKELKLLKNELTEDLENYGDAKASVTGYFMITYKITGSLTESQALSTGVSIILAAFVLILIYRNPSLGIIAIIPVGISIIWILGTMYYIGYSLNVMTVTVTSITIGIGIDYAIHATERFRLVADKTGDINRAVRETISHTGGALFIAALTTALGFGILIFAPIPPEQQFGVIMALTISYAFITSILVLPLTLIYWAKWRKKRKGYIISPKKRT
jgi:predicted RND superfamily exporter protein